VLLAEPPQTQFDLNFQILGFPVRVHPLFWLVGLLLGLGGGDGISLIIWFFAVFLSILIHELGHALMIRRFGRDAYIVLYAMGGLAIEGRPHSMYGSPWSFESYSAYTPPRSRSAQEQILISAAGPGIQFLLAAAVVLVVYATGGHVRLANGPIPLPVAMLGGELARNVNLHLLVFDLLYINIFWALVNLLPVLPLDGGQIALQVLVQKDPWAGMQRALWLSVITSGAMAIFSLVVLHQTFTMLMFASLAVSSYLALQQAGGRRPW
jgi:membrane-associated protease RseP (regulator of RpoE activity)